MTKIENKDTKSICILGDSHAAGLRQVIRHSEQFQFNYFAVASRIVMNMGMMRAAADGFLEPSSASLKETLETRFSQSRIRINGYDAICLVGLRLEFPYKLINDYYYHKCELKTMYCSERMLEDFQCDLIANQSIAMKLAKEIRKIDLNVPLIVIPNPLISALLKTVEIPSLPGITPRTTISPVRFFGLDSWLRWRVLLEKTFSELNVEFLYQPDDTVVDSIFTMHEFAISEDRAGLRHMNSEFWQKLCAQLLERISAGLRNGPG